MGATARLGRSVLVNFPHPVLAIVSDKHALRICGQPVRTPITLIGRVVSAKVLFSGSVTEYKFQTSNLLRGICFKLVCLVGEKSRLHSLRALGVPRRVNESKRLWVLKKSLRLAREVVAEAW